MDRVTLLIRCLDTQGIVAKLSQFVFEHGGNIIDSVQHSDDDSGLFFMRLEWDIKHFTLSESQLRSAIESLAQEFNECHVQLFFQQAKPRIAIFCSKTAHCIYDLLIREKLGEFAGEFVCVISNHADLKPIAEHFGLPFYHLPHRAKDKAQIEHQQQELLLRHRIDTVILARYMQILSADFVELWADEIINIHHSFLPAFSGAKPYHQAKSRGVKVIGATAHYVTEALDAGPIIAQDVIHVGHRDSVDDLVRKGRDIERQVLAKAVSLHLQRRVLVDDNKTILFE